MRKFSAAALLLSSLVMTLATAQETRKMIAEGDVIELLLLRQKSVQEELKVDPETVKSVREYCTKQFTAAQEVHKLPEAGQKPRWEKMRKENEAFLTKSLSSAQKNRLKQIAMQNAGLLWITRPSVAKQLKLTDDQMQQAKRMQQQAQTKVKDVMHSTKGEDRKMKLAELHKTTREELTRLLTDDQKATWKDLAGAPFKGKLLFPDMDEKN